MDSQYEHNRKMEKSQGIKASKAEIEALMQSKSETSGQASPSVEQDPIDWAMKNNPGLTREKAEKMAEEFGF